MVMYNSCIAHIINLTTQALLSTHNNSKHFDIATPDMDLLAIQDEFNRDEVGLVYTIVMKVWYMLIQQMVMNLTFFRNTL